MLSPMNSPTTSSRIALLPVQRPASGKRPAIRRYTLGRVVSDVDFGAHLLPVNGAPASGVRSP
jgi:hypothetical protein